MKVLRSVPRRSLGGVFQASTSSHGMSPPPHMDESTESMDLGVGWGLFHRMDESTGQCGVKGERRPQRKRVHWGQNGVLPPLCRLSHWR